MFYLRFIAIRILLFIVVFALCYLYNLSDAREKDKEDEK